MFCPNCGTQNPDTAQTCSKCNFHLKGAAAPKFKGTMLMMNQPQTPGPSPAGVPGVPPPGGGAAGPMPQGTAGAAPPRPGGAFQPPGAQGVPSRLKGTMVGVAPMAGAGGMPSPVAVPPPAGAPMRTPAPLGAAAPPPAMVPMGAVPGGGPQEPSSAFSPPVPQPGVNPLGGTVAADAGVFAPPYAGAQGGALAQPYGAQPGIPPTGPMPAAPGGPQFPQYGVPPPGQPGPYGAPGAGTIAAPYGTPAPNQYGVGAAPPYGGPPQQGWGPPPGYGPPMQQPMQQQGMVPYGQAPGAAGALVGTLPSRGRAAGPRRRSALMTLLLPFAVFFVSMILGSVLGMLVSGVFFLFDLVALGGLVWYLILAIQMAGEVKAVTQNPNFAWWPILVPFYGMYWAWILVPEEVSKAKQLLGVQQPPRPIVLYIFLWHFALASDLNDMVR